MKSLKILMQVVSVKIPNTSTDSHHSPEAFFREYGFESVNDNGVGFKRAIVPKSKIVLFCWSMKIRQGECINRSISSNYYLVNFQII